jgi:hypothetical protein
MKSDIQFAPASTWAAPAGPPRGSPALRPEAAAAAPSPGSRAHDPPASDL